MIKTVKRIGNSEMNNMRSKIRVIAVRNRTQEDGQTYIQTFFPGRTEKFPSLGGSYPRVTLASATTQNFEAANFIFNKHTVQ